MLSLLTIEQEKSMYIRERYVCRADYNHKRKEKQTVDKCMKRAPREKDDFGESLA